MCPSMYKRREEKRGGEERGEKRNDASSRPSVDVL